MHHASIRLPRHRFLPTCMRVRLRSRNIVAPGRPIVNVIGLMERCVCPRGSSVLRSPAQSISEHANRNCSAPTCREHARREDRPGSGFMNLQLQGQKTLLLVDALVVGFWEASYLMRARISQGWRRAEPSLKLPRIHRPITTYNPQRPADGLEGETSAHLVPPVQQPSGP